MVFNDIHMYATQLWNEHQSGLGQLGLAAVEKHEVLHCVNRVGNEVL